MNLRNSVFIVAGGTGGHIYPAIAIAEAFRQVRSDWDIFFVGTPQGLENKIVPAKGFSILHVNVGRLNQVSNIEKIKTLLWMPIALFQCWRLLRKYRPRIVLGVGGYTSGPMLLMAAFLGTPTAIWEPNAMPGLTNRWLASFVDECFLVFESAKEYLKAKRIVPSGMPVRTEIEKAPRRIAEPDELRLLIFGGSQGAKAINSATAEMLKSSDLFARKMKIVHQTGAADFARVKDLYGNAADGLRLELVEYLHDMHNRYEWADIVVSRAGASSVAELAACGKVSVLIPLPTAADNHQQKNAESLVSENAAVMILQKDLTPERLRETLQTLILDPAKRRTLQENIHKFYQPRAAEKIVTHLLKRIE